jgi:hypothetical protein
MNFTIPHEAIATCSYHDVLFSYCTLEELRHLSRVYGVTIKQSANKRQFAEAIEKVWLEQTEACLLIYPQDALKALQRLVKADGYLVINEELETRLLEEYTVVQVEDNLDDEFDEDGIDSFDGDDAFMDDDSMEIRYALAKNLRDAIAPVIDRLVNDARVLEWDEKSKWLLLLLECYGVLSLSAVEALSQKVTGKPITFNDVHFLLIKRNLMDLYVHGFMGHGELHLVSGLVNDPETLYAAILKRNDLSYAVYPKKYYLKDDIGVLPTPEARKAVKAVLTFLEQVNQGDEVMANIQLVIIWNKIQEGRSIDDVATILLDEHRHVSPHQYEAFKQLLVTMAELMPLWTLKGHTPKALGIKVFEKNDGAPYATPDHSPKKTRKTKQPSSDKASIYQLRIQLQDVEPPIWRCILVPSDIELEDLNKVIQTSMGWTNSHLHEFSNGKNAYVPSWELEDDLSDPGYSIAYEGLCLHQFLKKKNDLLRYEYDYGDSWEHLVVLEDIQPHRDGIILPVCIDGARHCPPEDCGGAFAYMNMLNVLKKPKHPEYKHIKSWLGGPFDAEAFDLYEVNDLLQQPNFGLLEWED